MSNILFFNADVGTTLEFTILQSDGTAYDVTGDTITLLVEGVDEFTCTVIDGPAGRVDYVVAANDFQPGSYRAQLKTNVGGVILHSPAFRIQVGQVVDTSAVVTAVVAPTEGAIPFGAVGGGAFATDATNLFWDDANNNLRLFGGTVGTSGLKVLVLGQGTAPTTSPADSVQLWAADVGAGGSTGFFLRGEQGSVLSILGTPTAARTDGVSTWLADRNGAGTMSPWVRTEDSGINERAIAWTINGTPDTTERTTTSLSTVDLSTITCNIPVGDKFGVSLKYRKTAGAAAAVQLGIKVNGTQIIANLAVSSATDRIEQGILSWGTSYASPVFTGETNYDICVPPLIAQTWTTAGAGAGGFLSTSVAAAMPTAAVTSVTITGLTGSASVTLAIKDVTVYRIAAT